MPNVLLSHMTGPSEWERGEGKGVGYKDAHASHDKSHVKKMIENRANFCSFSISIIIVGVVWEKFEALGICIISI